MHWLWQEVNAARERAIAQAALLLCEAGQPSANRWQQAVSAEAADILESSMKTAERRMLAAFREYFPRAVESPSMAEQDEPGLTVYQRRARDLRMREWALSCCEVKMARESLSVWYAAHERISGGARTWLRAGWDIGRPGMN